MSYAKGLIGFDPMQGRKFIRHELSAIRLIEGYDAAIAGARLQGKEEEREACAKIAEEHPWPTRTSEAMWPIERACIAAAIRARTTGKGDGT